MSYAVYADLQAGSTDGTSPQELVGTPSQSNGQQLTWLYDQNGGIVSGATPVTFDAKLSQGSATLTAAGTPDSVTGVSGSTIQAVTLVAGVNCYGKVAWSNVVVNFYSGGVLEQTVNVGSIVANSLTTGTPTDTQVVVTPSGSYDEAVVTGTMRLQCPDGTYPNPDDLFASVQISTT